MISMIIGIFTVNAIKNTKLYHLINENTISENESFYKFLGTGIIKKLFINTPLKNFNTQIVINKSKLNITALNDLKMKMTDAEIGHIVAFVVIIATSGFLYILNQNGFVIVVLNGLNITFNLYPILIQQQNKLKIDKMIKSYII